ncbi:MAG TPA: hydantoinase B/oxoprolinase family protein, partial [Solirubrobacteraceae bacterium]|nr:hydantoinase B/oxoprolinase family protein [Solirubrobacteraceae bacterium]
GLQIPVMKLYEGGRRNDALLQLVRANVRVPEQVAGDLDAMVAAGHVAARRLLDLAGELRSTDFTSVAQALQERGEQAMREAIGNLATGTYGGELLVEGADVPLMVAVRIDVDAAAGEISLDYAGTTPQVSTGHNATAGYTSAYTAYALKCLLAPDLPFTEGIFTPLTVNVPEGSVLGCRRPAAVGGRHLVGQSTTSLVIRVMAEAIPELAVADCGSPRPFITVAGRQADGAPFSLPILAMGGFGARAGSDGPPTMPFPSNTEAVPIETLEATTPLHLEEKELLCDSGGAGRRRGGLGQRFRARALVDGINVSVIATRTRYPAEGLFGGGSGGLARIAVRSGATGEERTLASVARLMTGDELVIESPGGGGYGSPVERDPAALEADVAGGYVSADAAAACYGR